MKRIFFLISILVSIIMYTCTAMRVKEKNLTRPVYEFQKTLTLEQVVGDFIPYFNVWKNYPVDYSEFKNVKAQDEAKLFVARKKITFVGNEFIILDKINSIKYELKQKERKNDDDSYANYSISMQGNIIGAITQPDIHKDFIFLYDQENKKYTIEGEVRKDGNDIQSFVFNIKHDEDILCSIFKQFSYAANKYEIIINRKFKNLQDPIFICLGIFIDQILKDNGYQYKN